MAVDVLLIGAHPDDVEWGAGGIALLLRNSGIAFAILDLTNGEMGSRGTPQDRKAEAVIAAEFLGASARETLQLPDCGLVDAPEHRRRIASVIRRYFLAPVGAIHVWRLFFAGEYERRRQTESVKRRLFTFYERRSDRFPSSAARLR